MNAFFISCPVGFELVLIQEIENFWFKLMDLDGLPTRSEIPQFDIDTGGIEFKTALHLGLQINFFTRIGLRILLRMESFESRYFDQFEKGVLKLNLEKFIEPQKINIQIESIKSRLFHEGNLLESCTKVLATRHYIFDKESSVTIFFRIIKDRVLVSIDTSGNHLHFRGYRQYQGEAPIRENLASLILQLSGLNPNQNVTVLDPYCGSGTFFFESQLLGFPNFEREYAFLKFKNTPAIFKSDSWKKNFRWIRASENMNYIGIEKNPDTFQKLQKNKEIFCNKFCPVEITQFCEDSEKIDLKKIEAATGHLHKPIYLITNPPYGERSASANVTATLGRMEYLSGLEKIIVIHPENWKFQFKRLKLSKSVILSNQGLKTKVSIFSRIN